MCISTYFYVVVTPLVTKRPTVSVGSSVDKIPEMYKTKYNFKSFQPLSHVTQRHTNKSSFTVFVIWFVCDIQVTSNSYIIVCCRTTLWNRWSHSIGRRPSWFLLRHCFSTCNIVQLCSRATLCNIWSHSIGRPPSWFCYVIASRHAMFKNIYESFLFLV